jgi:hypothetical protein
MRDRRVSEIVEGADASFDLSGRESGVQLLLERIRVVDRPTFGVAEDPLVRALARALDPLATLVAEERRSSHKLSLVFTGPPPFRQRSGFLSPAFSGSGSRWRTPTLDALGAGARGAYPIRAEQGVSVASKKSPPPEC